MDNQDTQQLRYLTRRIEQLENRILYLEKITGHHYTPIYPKEQNKH